jgi:hypothetical protein
MISLTIGGLRKRRRSDARVDRRAGEGRNSRQRRAVVVNFDGSGERELTYAAIATISCIVKFATTGFFCAFLPAYCVPAAVFMKPMCCCAWFKPPSGLFQLI